MSAASRWVRFRGAGVREMIYVALATMDVCLVAPLLAGLVSYVWPVDPLVLAFALLVAILGVQYLARASFRLSLRPWLRASLLGATILLTAVVAIHEVVYPEVPLFGLEWPFEVVRWLKRENLQGLTVPREGFIFVLVLLVWWRGLVLAQRQTASADVALRFRLGVVVLSVMIVLASLIVDAPLPLFVFTYFFAGLVGIALARADEALQRHTDGQSLVSLGWLVGIGSAGVAVVLLASGVAALLTGENLLWVGRPLLVAVRRILLGLIYVAGLVVEFVVRVAQVLLRDIDLEWLRAVVSPLRELRAPEMDPEPPRWSPDQLASLRTVAVLGGALLLVVAVALSLRWLRKRIDARQGGERESVWENVNVARGAERLARRAQGWLEQKAKLARSRLDRYWAAVTIRRIYARLGALAQDIGFPRSPQQTPYEYLPVLAEAFPGRRAELANITEAYVAVHYGETPEDPARLADVRVAWQTIRESSRKPP